MVAAPLCGKNFFLRVSGHEQDADAGAQLPQFLDQATPAEVRHRHIG